MGKLLKMKIEEVSARTMENSKEIASEMEATAAAYHIFLNVSLLGSKSIEEEDLMRFMIEEEVLKSSNRLAGEGLQHSQRNNL
ncbi:hypothetical protein ABKV19_007903 [Rosa sericea]